MELALEERAELVPGPACAQLLAAESEKPVHAPESVDLGTAEGHTAREDALVAACHAVVARLLYRNVEATSVCLDARHVAVEGNAHVRVPALAVEHEPERLALCAGMPAEGYLGTEEVERKARLDDKPREVGPSILSVLRHAADRHVALRRPRVVVRAVRRVRVDVDEELLKSLLGLRGRQCALREVGEVEWREILVNASDGVGEEVVAEVHALHAVEKRPGRPEWYALAARGHLE